MVLVEESSPTLRTSTPEAELYKICLPFRDQNGNPVPALKRRLKFPLRSTIQMPLVPPRSLLNASCEPSGERTACCSTPFSDVTRRKLPEEMVNSQTSGPDRID